MTESTGKMLLMGLRRTYSLVLTRLLLPLMPAAHWISSSMICEAPWTKRSS